MSDKSSLLKPSSILLVEDNDDDVLLTKHAFKNASAVVEFQVARDGVEALEMLRQVSPDSNTTLPDIILLDLNMPRMDGRQLLAELKQDERLKAIPVVILTTSAAECDVCSTYRNHASAYMTKPIDLQEFNRRIKCFVDFWQDHIVILPSECNC